MFANNVAAAIKAAGKILKEKNQTFYLPFGAEYSVYLKNLNSVRILAKVEIDGIDVGDGTQFVIQPNSSFELERFLKNGNFNEGNKLKFIERTGKVEAHRGIQIEDGLIRIEFQKEKVTPKPIVTEHIHKHHHDYYKYYPWNDPWYYPNGPFYNHTRSTFSGTGSGELYGCSISNNLGSASAGIVGNAFNNLSQNTVGTTNVNFNHPEGGKPSGATRSLVKMKKSSKAAVAEAQQMSQVNDAGITVAGSVSEQKFQNAAWFAVDEEKFVIVLKLLGEVGGKTIKQAITTKYKQTCVTCGVRNRGKIASFCRECGTALQII